MKKLLTVVSLLVCGVLGEAPYAPSGWRPDGPGFELPLKSPQQQYLPPVDPRNPPSDSYGPPEVDVSVQGLPTEEPQPLFRLSPINGQQYVGPAFNADVKRLDESLKQAQFQAQQERYRQLARQRQLEAQGNANQPTFQVPSQFVPRTTAKPTQGTTKADDTRTTKVETTTEALNLNEGEVLNKSEKKDKVTVEVSKERIQAFPAELFLKPLAQLQSQQQYAPLQLGQIRAPVYFQPAQGVSQKQVAGYDGATHFAALPSILAQQQLLQAQLISQQQNQAYASPYVIGQQQVNSAPYEQAILPANQFEIQPVQPLIQPQPVVLQPQLNQVQTAYGQPQKPNVEDVDEQVQSVQPQVLYQQPYPQGQQIYPQNSQQESYPQQVYPQIQQVYRQTQQIYPQSQQVYPQTQQGYPQTQQEYPQTQQQYPRQQYPQTQQIYAQQVIPQTQQAYPQNQPLQYPEIQRQIYQQQIYQQQSQQRQEGSLQSGFDANMQGNRVDQNEKDDDDDERNTATAVATAFGTRTQPRVAYGVPVPRVQTNPDYQTTTESSQDEGSDDGVAAGETTARSTKRKSAKLRSRRVRPVFTLDRSGHLVLAQEQ